MSDRGSILTVVHSKIQNQEKWKCWSDKNHKMNRKMHTKLTTTKTTSKTFYQKQTQLELGRIYRLYRGYSSFSKIFWPVRVLSTKRHGTRRTASYLRSERAGNEMSWLLKQYNIEILKNLTRWPFRKKNSSCLRELNEKLIENSAKLTHNLLRGQKWPLDDLPQWPQKTWHWS